jgi:hypothetical protein
VVLISSCNAQSANYAQKTVGTWETVDQKYTFVFNADGTGTYLQNVFSDTYPGGSPMFWGISADGCTI